MQSKWNGNDRLFWLLSLVFHVFFVLALYRVLFVSLPPVSERIEINIVEIKPLPLVIKPAATAAPSASPTLTQSLRIRHLKSKASKAPLLKKQDIKPVFGMDPKVWTDQGTDGPALIKGNTLEAMPSQHSSEDSSLEPLPEPSDEFSVSKMPIVLTEIKAEYSSAARTAGIEGSVLLEVLIDQHGRVRQVIVVKGLGYGLDEAAQAALYKFVFSPALVDQQAVAVKISYTYRFLLD